ncbi:MAG: virulence protein RhuM/Fic/DOC family protein [bacterium]|nr:virulence protein RhuM/Fic/DOC family protein [bacterium]
MTKKEQTKKGEIVIYKAPKGEARVEVRLEKETVWLTQKQMSLLFDKGIPTINEHIKNIFKEGELQENSVIRKFRITAADGKTYETQFYNLDVIISVGYRVKSIRGAQFRIWATKTLKNHLIKGYTINEKRLLEAKEKFQELRTAITFLQEKSRDKLLAGQEQEILRLLSNYSKTLTLLDKYDKNKLETQRGGKGKFILNYDDAKQVISAIKKDLIIKKEASELFGQEYEGKFKGIIGSIHQSFGGKELYASIEEKAAHFLYFAVKDHPFVDGNKRIASFLFVYFLDRNKCLYKESGEKKINDNALVVLTLLIAVSDPKEKDVMTKLTTNLIS